MLKTITGSHYGLGNNRFVTWCFKSSLLNYEFWNDTLCFKSSFLNFEFWNDTLCCFLAMNALWLLEGFNDFRIMTNEGQTKLGTDTHIFCKRIMSQRATNLLSLGQCAAKSGLKAYFLNCNDLCKIIKNGKFCWWALISYLVPYNRPLLCCFKLLTLRY